ncbi:hypothetical protein [Pantoea sp. SGAir0183]
MQKPRKNNIKSPDNSNLPSLSPVPQKKGVLIYISFFYYTSAQAKWRNSSINFLLFCYIACRNGESTGDHGLKTQSRRTVLPGCGVAVMSPSVWYEKEAHAGCEAEKRQMRYL